MRYIRLIKKLYEITFWVFNYLAEKCTFKVCRSLLSKKYSIKISLNIKISPQATATKQKKILSIKIYKNGCITVHELMIRFRGLLVFTWFTDLWNILIRIYYLMVFYNLDEIIEIQPQKYCNTSYFKPRHLQEESTLNNC